MLGITMAVGLFLMLSFGLITIISGTKYKPKQRDNISNITFSSYAMKKLDEDTLSRGSMSEGNGPMYGRKRGNVIEAYDYEKFEGETRETERGASFHHKHGAEIHGAPEGFEEVGYVHDHRDRPTPKYDVPEELIPDWKKSTRSEKILFPSKHDLGLVTQGKILLITSPHGDYRPWTRDEEGHVYSPGFSINKKE